LLKQTGVPTGADLAAVQPQTERLAKGPVAIIECFQQIPCNPCATACPRGAIAQFTDINDRPSIDHSKCNGCAICVANCPGLAIFVVDQSYRSESALIKLPYEQLPLPLVGETVDALDRAGEVAGTGVVRQVQNPKAFDRTAVIHLEVARELADVVRNIRVKEERPHA